MSQVIFDVKAVYGQIGSKTKVMPASIVTPREASISIISNSHSRLISFILKIIGLVSLKPNHITISGGILDKLAALPAVAPEEFKSPLKATELAKEVLFADYLASDGALLKDALLKDVESTRKLNDALKLFDDFEKQTKEYINELSGKA